MPMNFRNTKVNQFRIDVAQQVSEEAETQVPRDGNSVQSSTNQGFRNTLVYDMNGHSLILHPCMSLTATAYFLPRVTIEVCFSVTVVVSF